MVHRLFGLLIALAIVLASPPFGAAMAMSSAMAAADCACPDPDQDCGDHGSPGCSAALSCAVKCGPSAPMIGAAIKAPADRPNGASPQITVSRTLASVIAAPPFRPPAISILA